MLVFPVFQVPNIGLIFESSCFCFGGDNTFDVPPPSVITHAEFFQGPGGYF